MGEPKPVRSSINGRCAVGVQRGVKATHRNRRMTHCADVDRSWPTAREGCAQEGDSGGGGKMKI